MSTSMLLRRASLTCLLTGTLVGFTSAAYLVAQHNIRLTLVKAAPQLTLPSSLLNGVAFSPHAQPSNAFDPFSQQTLQSAAGERPTPPLVPQSPPSTLTSPNALTPQGPPTESLIEEEQEAPEEATRLISLVGVLGEPMPTPNGFRAMTGEDVVQAVAQAFAPSPPAGLSVNEPQLLLTFTGDDATLKAAEGIVTLLREARADYRRRTNYAAQAAEALAAAQRVQAQFQERERAARSLVAQANTESRKRTTGGLPLPEIILTWLTSQASDAAMAVRDSAASVRAARAAVEDATGTLPIPAPLTVPALAGMPDWPAPVIVNDQNPRLEARIRELTNDYNQVVQRTSLEDRRHHGEIRLLRVRVDDLCRDLDRSKRQADASRRDYDHHEREKRDLERTIQQLRSELDRTRVNTFSGRPEPIGPRPK